YPLVAHQRLLLDLLHLPVPAQLQDAVLAAHQHAGDGGKSAVRGMEFDQPRQRHVAQAVRVRHHEALVEVIETTTHALAGIAVLTSVNDLDLSAELLAVEIVAYHRLAISRRQHEFCISLLYKAFDDVNDHWRASNRQHRLGHILGEGEAAYALTTAQ